MRRLSTLLRSLAVPTLVAMVLLLPSGAIAQCNPRGFSSDQSDAIGNVRLQSSTNPVEIASNASAGRTVRASFIVIAIQQGANYPLTSAEDGVALDIDGDGDLDRVAWTRPNSNVAFLALDHDGDGRITSGRELFGNFTTPGASNDFTALARLAEETNGGARRHSISADDPLFARLLLWTDSNHNGVSEPSELRPASKKITDIGLGYQRNGRQDQWGDSYRFKGWVHVRTAPGRNKVDSAAENSTRTRPIYDVYFRVIQ